jgi:hypothetical protein
MIHKVRYASAQCSTTYGRLGKVFPGVNGEAFKGMMRYIQARFEEEGGRIQDELALDGLPKSIMEVAHAVLPPDDSSLQWSMPGSGLTEDPSATLDSLYERMVMRYEDRDGPKLGRMMRCGGSSNALSKSAAFCGISSRRRSAFRMMRWSSNTHGRTAYGTASNRFLSI